MSKTEVYSTYDTTFSTWNVMNLNNICLFYGSIEELEEWWVNNNELYYEN